MTSLFRHSQPSSLIWSSWNNARFCMFLKYIWFLLLFQDHAREHPQITLEHQKQNIQFLRDCQPQAAACTSSSLSFSVCVFCLGTSQWQSAMSGQSMTSILSPSRNETTGKMEHIQCQYIPIGTKKTFHSYNASAYHKVNVVQGLRVSWISVRSLNWLVVLVIAKGMLIKQTHAVPNILRLAYGQIRTHIRAKRSNADVFLQISADQTHQSSSSLIPLRKCRAENPDSVDVKFSPTALAVVDVKFSPPSLAWTDWNWPGESNIASNNINLNMFQDLLRASKPGHVWKLNFIHLHLLVFVYTLWSFNKAMEAMTHRIEDVWWFTELTHGDSPWLR